MPKALVPPLMLARFVVLPTVSFDRNPQLRACKIQHEWWHRVLAAEVPAERIAAQPAPQPAFGSGRKFPRDTRHFEF
jgi:hypothetical protein